MAVKFVIDSASDILPEEARALGVTHCPLQVMFGQEVYDDAVTLTHEEFYKKLAASQELPTTSQVTPDAFAKAYAELTGPGHEVVAITVSSALSGTYQSAMIAAADFEGRVYVVDSRSAAIGERVLLMRGLELAQQGLTAAQIAAQLEQEKQKVQVVAIVDTLEYLKKGGRISATVAFAGGLLGIKPAIAIEDGGVAMAGTARGGAKVNALLKQLIDERGGVNWSKSVAFVYSGESDEKLQQFLQAYPEVTGGRESIPIYSLGCAIGTHVGPGAFGVAFFRD